MITELGLDIGAGDTPENKIDESHYYEELIF